MTPESPSSRRAPRGRGQSALWTWAFACAAIVLAALLARGLIQQALYDWFTLAQPYFVNPMEGREAVKAWMLANGLSIYPAMPGPSAIVTIYPPLYHLLTMVSARITGDYLLAGRLVSLLSTLAVAFLVVGWVRDETGSRPVALLAGLSLLADPFMTWGVQARPDMAAHALALGGAWLFSRADGRRGAIWAGVLSALALLAKQQTLPFVLGTALWGLLKGSRRRLLIPYLAALILLAGLASGALDLATHGQFLTDILAYPRRMSEMAWYTRTEDLLSRLRTLWGLTAWKTAIAGCWIVVCLLTRRLNLACLLLAVSAPFVLKLLGTWGADYNYALGIVILLYPCLGMLAARLARLSRAGPTLAAALFILAVLDGGHHFSREILANPHQGKWAGVREAITERLLRTPGPVLANAEGGQLLLGQGLDSRLEFFDAIELALFEKAGFWRFKESDLARNLSERKYSLVVLSNDFPPEGMKRLLESHYAPEARLGQYELYAPRPEDVIIPIASLALPKPGGGVTLRIADEENLKRSPDHIEPMDQSRPGLLVIEAESPRPLRELSLALFPRLNNADGSAIEIEAAGDGGESRSWTCPTLPGREWSGEWEVRSLARFAVRGRAARVTFRLRRNAQLYFDAARPMTMYLLFGKEGAPAPDGAASLTQAGSRGVGSPRRH